VGNRLRRILILLTVALAGSACATSEQWAEWRQHSTHFASNKHLAFSVRNRGANPIPRVSQQDVEKATAESWWGDPIVVRPEQIFTN
jgi:hypothetical protein